MHGYGLENIQMIVEKYKGMMDLKQENNEYEVIIVIPATTPPKKWLKIATNRQLLNISE